ncbi:MAG TPA: winged helix-turn-helix domain-containing protein [Rhizomicrobium sp.]|jgi:Tol biopolymer transport system component/DNA-binding winged helix-turn-helix (wHTH) protein|nr:winged helix-turn-helix domain-containing protein [Rhizomicrobium sp.]
MNDATPRPRTTRPIELAAEPDFDIGGLHVSPPLRLVCSREREELIEPRAMQVLVALARADGAVLSRDTLIEQCWGGRIVGDDAINSCIAKVRATAAFTDPPAFVIETIPRVGYQLRGRAVPAAGAPEGPLDAASSGAQTPRSSQSGPHHQPPAAEIPRPGRHSWSWIVAAAAGSLLTASIVIAWAFSRLVPPPHWVVARLDVPIASALISRHPAISPDGSMIAYSAGPDVLSRKIYLRRISSGGAIKLTDDSFDDASPTWSPDGNEIAYAAYRDGETCHIMVAPALAGSSREVGRCRVDERTHIVWSPAGSALYFLDVGNPDGFDRIMRLDLASGRVVQLTHPPAGSDDEGEPAVSPDGHWIAFCRGLGGGKIRGVLFDLQSGRERNFDCYEDDDQLGWSDDSSTAFMTTNSGDQHVLWAVPIDGSAPSRVLSSPQRMERIASGPRGLLAIEISRLVDGLARSSADASEKPAFIESEIANTFTPDVAGDGTIAAAQERPDGAGLWVFPKTGPARKIFTLDPGEGDCAEPRWSPDGTKIAISSCRRATTGLRIVSSDGAVLARIPFPGSSLGAPGWAADGQSLIVPVFSGREWRLWYVETSGKIRPLAYTGWANVRMRGSEIYGVRDDSDGVWRIDGTPRRITTLPAFHNPTNWSVAGNEIAYAVNAAGQHRQIFGQPIAGGAAHFMAEVPNYASSWGMAWDPSSQTVVYVARISMDSDIELLHLVRQ